ncbi:MAG: diguanylate cyclase [Acidobacteriota bacterium]|nr:diguanylate cyclase [Acidobacteriota bacterium]
MRALIAEDDSISRRMLEAFLVKWGYEVMVAAEGEEAWAILHDKDSPRLAILDWMMPGRDGIDICRSLRQRKAHPYTYIILLTARGQKEDIVEGLEAGADDYVTKPFDPYELRARLRAGRRIVELQEQLLQAREALRDQASRDPLTGLWNHGTILAILRKEVARAARTHGPFALAMADVDRFKAINDTYGHPAGDAVLREASRRLRGAMRTYDSLGRYGGDEFLAVVPGCDVAGVARFAESFRARIDRKAVETPEGLIPVTLSLGVVALENLGDVSSDTLVRIADTALYRAKIAGRNCVALATAQDIEKEVSKHIQECEEPGPDDLLTDLPALHPPI